MMTQARFRFSLCLGPIAAALLFMAAGCKSPDVEDIRAEGIRQYRNQQYVESTATFRHALHANPSDAPSAYYMGLNYRAMAARKFRDGDVPGAQRELDTAINYFSQAIKHWPNYQAAVEAKTESFELRSKYEQALATTDAVAENNRGRSVELLIYNADKYRDLGDYDGALKRYQAALAVDPNNAKAYASLGQLYAIIGDRPKAVDAYARAHELDPRNTYVTDQLARLGVGGSGTGVSPDGGLAP